MLKLIRTIIFIVAIILVVYSFFVSPVSGLNLVIAFVIPFLIIVKLLKMLFGDRKNKF